MIKNYKYKIIFLAVAAFIIAITIIFFQNNDNNLVYKNSISIEIGDFLPTIESYVDAECIKFLDNKNIEWQDVNLEENRIYKVGKYTGYFIFKNDKKYITLEVIDKEKPTINGVKDITVYANETIDLLKNVTATDNSHDEIYLNIEGEYDLSVVGEYKLSYVATDKSGNKTIENFKLTVKEKNNQLTNYKDIIIGNTSKGYTIKKKNNVYYIDDILIVNKTYSLPNNYLPGKLLDTFMSAFYNMQTDAATQGVTLNIISGYRSYSTQYNLYTNYVNRDGKTLADTYSARAGHSEHQSGLAADINNLDQNFINTTEGKWLNNNCYKYGFIIRYPLGKENQTGYMYEPWHIRYIGVDIATLLYNNGDWISLEEYLGITSEYTY